MPSDQYFLSHEVTNSTHFINKKHGGGKWSSKFTILNSKKVLIFWALFLMNDRDLVEWELAHTFRTPSCWLRLIHYDGLSELRRERLHSLDQHCISEIFPWNNSLFCYLREKRNAVALMEVILNKGAPDSEREVLHLVRGRVNWRIEEKLNIFERNDLVGVITKAHSQ